ncbi:MAG: peptidylprolyl isomerase [Mycobacterium sp.]
MSPTHAPPDHRPDRQAPVNGFAIASLVCAFVFAPLGILFGHLSLGQLKRSGERGLGLAIAGLAVGYAVVVQVLLILLVAVVGLGWLIVEVARLESLAGPPAVTIDSTHPAELPAFKRPVGLGANCQYPAAPQPPSRPVSAPPVGHIATEPAAIAVTVATSAGPIGLTLNNAQTPCTVNNFVSLARQKFFDGTRCHRLSTSASLHALQCGDPTGTGQGGPGYRFPNEYPTNQFRLTDPMVRQPVRYPRGTLAMANSGPGTNGSQFLLIFADSVQPPNYTVFGTIDPAGLMLLDRVAAAGVRGGSDDGSPAMNVAVTSVQLP